MSNSMYSNIDNDDVFASAMEDDEIVENPFVVGDNQNMEPLHSVDAARRLLATDDELDMQNEPSSSVMNQSQNNISSNNAIGNSLLERIQQQKKQHNTSSGAPYTATTQSAGNDTNTSYAPAPNTSEDFGYPMVQEGAYSSRGSTENNIRIPEYSQVPAPSPYNTDSYPVAGGEGNNDYKETMLNALSTIGSAASTVAKGAYQGTKYVYGNLTKKGAASGSNGTTSRGGEMDYQRESLLMDPHDLEDRAVPISSSSEAFTTAATPAGLRAGVDVNTTSVDGSSTLSTILSYVKIFLIDMKDLFLGASRNMQIFVVALSAFIVWLIFFE